MSKYHQDVWEQYRIFALEFDESGLAAEMEALSGQLFQRCPVLSGHNRNLTVSSPVLITDGGGRWFEKKSWTI